MLWEGEDCTALGTALGVELRALQQMLQSVVTCDSLGCLVCFAGKSTGGMCGVCLGIPYRRQMHPSAEKNKLSKCGSVIAFTSVPSVCHCNPALAVSLESQPAAWAGCLPAADARQC